MRTATVWIDPETRMIAVRTPYDTAFTASVKTMILPSLRRWDPTRKIWLVDQSMMDKLQELLGRLGYEVHDGTMAAETATPSNGASPFHEMICDAPLDTLRKVYRVLAIDCHPDKGGNKDTMAKINVAWDKIQRLKA